MKAFGTNTMSPYQSEELENIRRQARYLKREAESETCARCSSFEIDIAVSILDIVERIKNDNKAQNSVAGY